MPGPFSRLLWTTSPGPRSLKVVIAVSGPALFCFNAKDGNFLSRWSHNRSSAELESTNKEKDDDGTEPPAKRQRTSEGEEDVSDAASAEVLVENGSTERPRRRKKKPQPQPSIIKLCATSDGAHVVAVTGEDKTIRVLELVDGQLRQISERQMPKKPSSITLSPDQQLILAADKFGDVYSLPLIIQEGVEAPQKAAEQKAYKPAATNLTVHTKKNLQALQHQLKSQNRNDQKKTYDFEHTLLLGHVSLLTDILAVVRNVNGHKRNYILTSDRDEHIRVSRGIPQTHIIETFCLGHTSFINKLLIPETHPDVLISGGGDDFILTWDWVQGQEIGRVSLLEHVRSIPMSLLSISGEAEKPKQELSENKIAVSGMWSVSWQTGDKGTRLTNILIACEAVPALIVFRLDATGLHHRENIALKGNVLDVLCDEDAEAILVSVDNVHAPGSITEVAKSASRPLIQTFSHSAPENRWQAGGKLIGLERRINDWSNHYPGDEGDVEDSVLSGLLYGIEHLRKKLGGEPEEEG